LRRACILIVALGDGRNCDCAAGRADDRGDPVVQLAPPLIIGQPEFDEIESILRDVLTQAWSIL